MSGFFCASFFISRPSCLLVLNFKMSLHNSNVPSQNASNQYFPNINKCNLFFKRKFPDGFRGLTVLQINARSIDSEEKMSKFKSFLISVKFPIDVIVVGETSFTYETP